MIVNVISGQSSGYTNPNPFPGMSLAEACGMAQAYTADALNEMNMSILLNEHAYLLENGTEIQYVNEANYQLKEKIKGAIDKVTKTVSDMWDKLITWVQDRVEDVREFLNKSGINKKKLDNIIANWSSTTKYNKEITNWVDNKKLSENVSNFLALDTANSNTHINSDTDLKKAIRDAVTEQKHTVEVNKDALTSAENVVFNTDRTIFNSIRKAKATALKTLNDAKKDIREENDEDKSDKLKTVNATCRYISLASSEFIKWYHSYISQNVEVLKFALKNKSIAKDTYDGDKDLDKAIRNWAKTDDTYTYNYIKQRFVDGDSRFTRGEILKHLNDKPKTSSGSSNSNAASGKAESAIFSGDRFFSIY